MPVDFALRRLHKIALGDGRQVAEVLQQRLKSLRNFRRGPQLGRAARFVRQPFAEFVDQPAEVRFVHGVVGEEELEQPLFDDIGERPTVGLHRIVAPADVRRVRLPLHLGREELHPAEGSGNFDAEQSPIAAVIRFLLEILLVGAVDEEEVVVLDVEDDRRDLESVAVARRGEFLALRFAQQHPEDVQQEARLRPQAGDAVHVHVPAVLAEQVVEVERGPARVGGSAVLEQPDGQGVVDAIDAVPLCGLRGRGEAHAALLRRRSVGHGIGAQDHRFGEGHAFRFERGRLAAPAVEARRFLADVLLPAAAVDLPHDADERDRPPADFRFGDDDLGALDALRAIDPEEKDAARRLVFGRRGHPAEQGWVVGHSSPPRKSPAVR